MIIFFSYIPTGLLQICGKLFLELTGKPEKFVLDSASLVILWSHMLQLAAWEYQFIDCFTLRWIPAKSLLLGMLVTQYYLHYFFQATNWVKSRETVLLMIISISIVGMTGLLSLSTGAGRAAGSTVFNRCLGQTSAMEVKYNMFIKKFRMNRHLLLFENVFSPMYRLIFLSKYLSKFAVTSKLIKYLWVARS